MTHMDETLTELTGWTTSVIIFELLFTSLSRFAFQDLKGFTSELSKNANELTKNATENLKGKTKIVTTRVLVDLKII